MNNLGIAFGCAFITPTFIIVDYFDKKLGLVNALTIAGTGLKFDCLFFFLEQKKTNSHLLT